MLLACVYSLCTRTMTHADTESHGCCSGGVYRGLLNGATHCALKVFNFQQDASLPKYFIQVGLCQHVYAAAKQRLCTQVSPSFGLVPGSMAQLQRYLGVTSWQGPDGGGGDVGAGQLRALK